MWASVWASGGLVQQKIASSGSNFDFSSKTWGRVVVLSKNSKK